MKKKVNKIVLYSSFVFFCFLFSCIVYASISSVNMEVDGVAKAESQDGIFITDVVYNSGNNVDEANSSIKSFYQTMMSSHIELGTSGTSSITYTISLYNNSDDLYRYNGPKFDNEFYDNNNIIFSVEGLNIGDTINSKDKLNFTITFSYSDTSNITNNILNSYITFSFQKIYTVTYENLTNTNLPTYVVYGEDYVANLGVADYKISIYVSENLLSKDEYTYNDGTFVIPKPTGNMKIIYTEDKNMNDAIIPVKKEEGTGAKLSDDFTSEYVSNDTEIKGSTKNRFRNISENYDTSTNTYTLTVKKTYDFWSIFSPNNQDFNLNFKLSNSSNYVWTNVTSSESHSSTFSNLSNVSSSVDKTTIPIGDSVNLNMKFRLKIGSGLGTDELKYQIKFNAGGEQQVTNVNILFN